MLTHILPLLVFTTLAGTAAGAYAVNAVRLPQKGAQERAWLFPLVCLVLLGVGLLGTLAHLGQPLRFINGMANPASMISQESYWSIAFGIVLVVDLALQGQRECRHAASLGWRPGGDRPHGRDGHGILHEPGA